MSTLLPQDTIHAVDPAAWDPWANYFDLMQDDLVSAAEWLGSDEVVEMYRPFRRLRNALTAIEYGECDDPKAFAKRVLADLDAIDELGEP